VRAFIINRGPSVKDLEVDLGPDYFLPDVICPHCREEWGAPWFSFPAVHPPWVNEFPFKEDDDIPVVPWEEFLKLRERLELWDPGVPKVIPGSAFGHLSGTSSRRHFPEFFCDGFDIIVGPKTRDYLKAHGVSEPWAPVSITYKGEPVKERFCVQPRIIDAVIPDQRKDLIRRECKVCGFLDWHPSIRNNLGSTFCLLRKSVLREASHFFVVRETGALFFTEHFLQMLGDLNPLGDLQILHRGDFV